jgi:ParB-like chromosome segregation protein Spo0J
MSDIDPGVDNVHVDGSTPPVPLREGLPQRYRMRADAHYVEQLDSSMFSAPIRHLDVRSIDPLQRDARDGEPSTALIESVRRHGILQPLLVRSRSGRFQVVAGTKRLAAAVEVGLREVPCLVERLDDDEARSVAAATNVSNAPADTAAQPVRMGADPAWAALTECLTAVASSAGLLTAGPTLTQSAAVSLVRAETDRALRLVRAAQVLRGEIRPRRRKSLAARVVLDRVLETTEAERRLRDISLTLETTDAPAVKADADLLVGAVAALVLGAAPLLEGVDEDERRVTIGARGKAEGVVGFVVSHEDAELSGAWRSILAEDAWDQTLPGGTGITLALALLRAAKLVAEMHGGTMSVDCADGSTILSITVPADR